MCWSEWAGGRDLFTPIVALEETHALFQRTVEGPGHAAARRLMREVFANLRDIDTNFVREFQTSGFSARVFELALFAYLQEQGCSLERTQTAPDFVLLGDSSAAIEVTTTNPPQDVVDTDGSSQVSADGAIPDDKAFIFQIGKALRRKLLKRDAQGRAYWELPHVEGIPFVIAVGAFHEQATC